LEPVLADAQLPVALSPDPFSRALDWVSVPAGSSVWEVLAAAVDEKRLPAAELWRTEIYVDAARLPRETALDTVLHEGQLVSVQVEPLGGGGGGRKNVGQILLQIAVIAATAWIGGAGGGLIANALPMGTSSLMARTVIGAAQLAVAAGGMALSAALFKPETNQAKANDRYALQSSANRYRPWEPFPVALGEVIAAPDLAVKTHTRTVGDEVWLYGILGVHYGPCETSEEKIGDTLISSMGPGEVQIVKHLTPGPRTFQLCPDDVDEVQFNEQLEATPSSSTPIVRGVGGEGERFDFDLFLPGGLHFAKDDGRILATSVTVFVRYRPVDETGTPTGTGAWTAGLTISLSSTTRDPWRVTRSLSLPLGRYEFEIRRSSPADDNRKRADGVMLTAIKAIAFRKPVVDETLSLIEFRVRATAVNQGSLAAITMRIKPKCQTWTGSAWGPEVATSNPAALTRWLLTGPCPAKPLAPTMADARLRAWSALCDEYGWTTNIYLTESRSQSDGLSLLEQAGRASLFWDGVQVVASAWVEKPAPRQLFAGANLRDHQWEYVYSEPLHAFRVEFQNIDKGGEPDEVFVYADGYAATAGGGKQAATLIERVRLEGQKTLTRAYKDGRWRMAARTHQRRIDTWRADIEHIVCEYGDRVRVAWPRLGAGSTSARVRSRRWSGGQVSGLRLTEPVQMEPGKSYALDLRLADQLLTAVPVVNPATTQPVVTREIQFAAPRMPGVAPMRDDLIAFGPSTQVSEDVEIIDIQPDDDLGATLTGVRYVAPLLMAAETGPVPPLQSGITGQRSADPPRPTLLGVQVTPSGAVVSFAMPTWRGSPITGYSCRWRAQPPAGESGGWMPLPTLGGDALSLKTPPLEEAPVLESGEEATRIEVQIVALTAAGRASPPLTAVASLPVVATPIEDDWQITPQLPTTAGVQLPAFDIVGTVSAARVGRVLVEFGSSESGPFAQAFDGPPVNGAVRAAASGLKAGEQVWFAISYWSPQGVPSGRFVFGPYTTPGMIAGDTQNVGGVPAPDLLEVIGDHMLELEALVASGAVIETRTTALEASFNASNPVIPVSSPTAKDAYTFSTGAPSAATSLPAANVYSVAGEGQVLLHKGSVFMGPKELVDIKPDRFYKPRFRARRKVNVPVGTNTAYWALRLFGDGDANLGNYPSQNLGLLNIADGWKDFEGAYVSGAAILAAAAGTIRARPMVRFGSDGSSANQGEVEVSAFSFEEVTGEAKIAARVTETETAVAGADGLLAYWKREAAVPGASAFIIAQAKSSSGAAPTSSVAIGGSMVAIANPAEDGGYRVAMKTENFETIFYGGLSAASFTLLGNGVQWQLAYRSKTFVRGDGETISFGANLGGLPQYEFLRDNLLPLSAGETYALTLTSLTATGATVSAKINVPGSPGAQSNGPTSAVQSSGPRYQLGVTAASKPVSADGMYSVSGGVQGYVRVYAKLEEETEITVSGTVVLWARKAGVWAQVGTASWSHTGTYFNPGLSPISVPFTAGYSGVIQMGSSVESIGVTIGTAGAGTSSVDVSSLSTSWMSQSTPSGVRSALASGAKTTIRIIPQG